MIQLACPVCRGELIRGATGWTCPLCICDYALMDRIGRFLPAARMAAFAPFLQDAAASRVGEWRAPAGPSYFRRLPEPTAGDPLASRWAMRARTWAVLQRRVIPAAPPSLAVIDVGAGTGWLSNRLTLMFHEAAAVDLTIDPTDGLGAARHFTTGFGRYQAEMDALPFADGTADLVVFNASLHHSTDLERTMREALRVLGPKGRIVVMDSPIHSAPTPGVLTRARLDEVAAALGLRWDEHRVRYGWRSAWRARRAPSRFALLVTQIR